MVNAQKRGWCFTHNNYSEKWKETLESLKHKWVYIIAGKEKGEKGTPHLQGAMWFKNRKTMKTVKNIFKKTEFANMHLEPMGGKLSESITYCSKEDKEPFTTGSPPEDKSQGQRTDLKRLRDLALSGATDLEMAMEYPVAHSKAYKWAARIRAAKRQKLAEEALEKEVSLLELRKWQTEILEVLDNQPERKLTWVWEEEGGTGKSTLARYLAVKRDAFLITGGKHIDILYAFSKDVKEYVVLDLSRSQAERVPYAVLETLLNGFASSGKYESTTLTFKKCKILVLANFLPEKSELSNDRWDIHHIKNI